MTNFRAITALIAGLFRLAWYTITNCKADERKVRKKEPHSRVNTQDLKILCPHCEYIVSNKNNLFTPHLLCPKCNHKF